MTETSVLLHDNFWQLFDMHGAFLHSKLLQPDLKNFTDTYLRVIAYNLAGFGNFVPKLELHRILTLTAASTSKFMLLKVVLVQ